MHHTIKQTNKHIHLELSLYYDRHDWQKKFESVSRTLIKIRSLIAPGFVISRIMRQNREQSQIEFYLDWISR
jgi:hypothetical protein